MILWSDILYDKKEVGGKITSVEKSSFEIVDVEMYTCVLHIIIKVCKSINDFIF